MLTESRFRDVRRLLARTKRVLAVASIAAFGVVLGLVRGSPAQPSAPASSSVRPAEPGAGADGFFDGGVAPSQSAPEVRTGAS